MTAAALRDAAVRALQAGRIEDGIIAYAALLAVAPEDADDWYNYAYLLRCARRFDAALAGYGEALARNIRQPETVHVNRAAILSEHLGDDRSAQVELETAVRLAPDFVIAWLNLGNLHEDRGDATAARECYARAIALYPSCGRAVARAAMLDLRDGPPEPVVAALRRILTNVRLEADDAGEIGFALGHALDAAARYDEAFAAFDTANRASRAAAGPFVSAYDPQAHERLIDRIIAAFPIPMPRGAWAGRSPLFICGMFRSGSTLAEQILKRHSLVTAGGELDFLPALVATQVQPFPEAAVEFGEAEIAALRGHYLSALAHIHPGAGLVTDKRPDNYLYIGLIKAMFPAARIIHTIRDPRDTALSAFFLNFDPSVGYAVDLSSIGHYQRQQTRLMAHWRALYPDTLYDLDYDALVRSPAPTIRALIAECGLQWEEACLDSAANRAVVRTASTWQVRQALHTRSSGRWRHYAAHLQPLVEALEGH